eukprot:scaffold1629_cov369-Prasinococcus_capsulatus_cf.AAC.10
MSEAFCGGLAWPALPCCAMTARRQFLRGSPSPCGPHQERELRRAHRKGERRDDTFPNRSTMRPPKLYAALPPWHVAIFCQCI